MNDESIGNLFVDVDADVSGLSTLDQAAAKVASAAAEAQAAWDKLAEPVAKVGDSSTQTTEALNSLANATTPAAAGTEGLAQAMADLAGAVSANTAQLAEVSSQIGNLKPSADESARGVGDLVKAFTAFFGVEISLRAIKDAIVALGEASVGTYAEIEKTTIALTAITGSVERAVDTVGQLKQLAMSDALSFPSLVEANQKVLALGFSARQANESLRAAADAAAAVGLNFANVAPALDRMAQSGMLSGRMLATVGLNLQDVAKAANATVADLQGPGNIFKAMDPGDRLDVLIKALQKYQGTAQQVARSLSGEFQALKTQMSLALSGAGEALAPLLKNLMDIAQQSVVPAIEQLVAAFKDLMEVIGPLVGVLSGSFLQSLSDIGTIIGGAVTAIAGVINPVGVATEKFGAATISWKSFTEALSVISPLHIAATEINLFTGSMQMFAQAALTMKQRFADVTDSLKTFIDKATSQSGLLGVRLEMEAQNKALADAKTNLALVTAAYEKHMATAGQVQAAQDAVNKALFAMDPAAKAASDASKNLSKELATFGKSAMALVDTIPKTFEGYTAALEEGGRTARAMLASVETDINKAIELMGRFKQVPQELLEEFGKLKQAQDTLQAFLGQEAIDKALAKIQDLFNKYPLQVQKLDAATLDYANSLRTLDAAAADPKGLQSFVEELGKALTSQKEADDSTKTLTRTLDEGSKAVNKFGADWVKNFDPAVDNAKKLNAAIITLGVSTGDLGRQIVGMTAEMQKFGLLTEDSWKRQIDEVTTLLAQMQRFNQPLTEQLALQDKLYQLELQRNIALGASGEATLALVEKWQQVKNAEQAARDETMLLADTYEGMLKSFGEAWDAVSKGIADAMVSGQNFGQVFTQVLDNLKKQLAELVVDYLMKRLKDAILQNTDLLGGFNKVFNSIFGVEGTVFTGLKRTAQAVDETAQKLEAGFDHTIASVEDFQKTTTESMQATAKSVNASATSMVADLNLIATAIGAIASIFSAIELMHTNKLLGEIEVSTRKMELELGGNGAESIFGWTKVAGMAAHSIEQILWNPIGTFLLQINSDLDAILQEAQAQTIALETIIANGIAGGGGGGGGSNGDVLVLFLRQLEELRGAVTTLQTAIAGPYGMGPGAQGGLAGDVSSLGSSFADLGSSLSTVNDALQTTASTAGAVSDALGTTAAAVNAATSAIVPALATAAAASSPAFTTFTPFAAPSVPSLPGPGVSGSNSGILTPVLGSQANFTFVVAPNVDQIANQVVARLQQMGIRNS